jgi:hypothetical protein
VFFIENVQRYAVLFAAVTHLVEGVRLETLLTLKEKKSIIFLLSTWRSD